MLFCVNFYVIFSLKCSFFVAHKLTNCILQRNTEKNHLNQNQERALTLIQHFFVKSCFGSKKNSYKSNKKSSKLDEEINRKHFIAIA